MRSDENNILNNNYGFRQTKDSRGDSRLCGGNGMLILDNINTTVKDDLKITMKKGSKVSIAAACFSIYP